MLRLLLPFLALALPLPAAAQGQQPIVCADRVAMLGGLAMKWQETLVAAGITQTGGLLEVVAAPAGKTWTIIMTMPGEPACAMAAGRGWQMVPPPDPDERKAEGRKP